MKLKHFVLLSLILLLAAAGVIFARAGVLAQSTLSSQIAPIHPQFAFLDPQGQNVLDTAQPVSTMKTCGQCHDTDFIASHSFHADLGLSSFGEATSNSAHSWDQSDGLFGKWNPLTYRYLSAAGDERLDLGTSGWIQTFGDRIVGGGPAVQSRTGQALPEGDPNPEGWDWQQSGVMEMDCFLCHFSSPNNDARVQALQDGKFQWANTATLVGTGLVESAGGAYNWNPVAFTEDGLLLPESITIHDPTNENCAQCHGVVHTTQEPLALAGCDLTNWQTATTGQVISAQKISDSGLNLSGKGTLTRSFDIHAERGLKCTDCHYSLNNPVYYQAGNSPAYLQFDPRRLEIGEYLQKPDHNFARGQSAQYTIAPELKGTMRRCESCHNANDTHDWLPYVDRHLDELACESCHIPKLYAPAVQSYDWTVLQADGQPVSVCRGVEGNTATLNDLVTGFTPVLMPRENIDGNITLAPYNLVTAWYWVYDSSNGSRPVRMADLQAAFFEDGSYAPEILQVLDSDRNGSLSASELSLDTSEKKSVVASRLSALGLQNPHIEAEVQPYSVNHNVAGSEWATKDCQACHSDDSLITQPIQLADTVPAGVQPEFVKDANTVASGSLYTENGALYYRPATRSQKLYVFGHDRVSWIDWLGALFFVGVLGAVAVHGGLRFRAALKAPRHKPELVKVYMYTVYERFWHWLQTFVIVLLLFTGLIIHRPDMFGIFSFRYVVLIHNILAALLVINAALSLFYHLVSGEIRQYIPRPYGFFNDAIVQVKYYLHGIFKGEAHPFEKVPQKKLNPLQQITYFGILNVLLPLQIITGALMWGVQQWPQIAGWFGGLPYLAPFHSLVAWTFAAFIVGHIYLTTTGHQPLTSIKAMMDGWEDVNAHVARSPEAETAAEEQLTTEEKLAVKVSQEEKKDE
jgi:thiosulfate reductase cytochrome b subunit